MKKSANQAPATPGQRAKIEKLRRYAEATATFGILIVAIALVCPFTNLTDTEPLKIYKWIYAAGALIYTTARVAAARDPEDSLTLKRLRRMECWAGFSFIIGAFFWFYNEGRFDIIATAGPLAILRETIIFSLVGAVIQVIASWMIYFRQKREGKTTADGPSKPKK